MAKKYKQRRPKNVIDAGNEINRLAAEATSLSQGGAIPGGLVIALRACLQAYKHVQSAALTAGAIARARMDSDSQYSDPWPRQWCAVRAPSGDDQVKHELPLWYLAIILRNVRALMRRAETDGVIIWDASTDDWKRIGATMRLAKDALACGSLEARATATSRLKEGRTETRKRRGPDMESARMASVHPISA